jgi:glycosyltransferase involved in cell wall biosynthesis
MTSQQTLTVIIPNTNSLLIGDILRNLKRQTIDMAQAEVLVIGADEPGLVKEDDLVRFIPTGDQKSHASDKRNLGMQQARGDIFCFLDDDCLPAPDWLEHHLARHQAGEKIVGGAVTFGTENYLQLADNVSAFHDLLPFTETGLRPYLATANLSVASNVAREAGEMKRIFKRAEDLEWTVRFRKLGYQLYFEPRAVVFHNPDRYSLSSVWQHWIDDAPGTLSVRLHYSQLLKTPYLAQYRPVFLLAAPLVALWATVRTFSHPTTVRNYWYILPLVYLTKLAWCWSAFKNFPVGLEEDYL